ncbi:hypothetical protein [Chitinophaga sp. HK235]|uniref:hypothetical protein n=1 Tax=Chitinophaga sp. HK235 TaxID=2952571 RepID=UPI001BAA9AE2|nr:hypothetical protein [Chitinophaga sp. HK235]
MTLIPPATCPNCGSTQLIRTVPEKDPFNVMVICHHCQRVISEDTPAGKPGKDINTTVKAINERSIQLCLNSGKVHGIKHYYTEMNKLPGSPGTDLMQAKTAVEELLQARGLTNAVKKPNRNGCVITLIVILLIIASIVYFYSQR